jgi:hypothetical protein
MSLTAQELCELAAYMTCWIASLSAEHLAGSEQCVNISQVGHCCQLLLDVPLSVILPQPTTVEHAIETRSVGPATDCCSTVCSSSALLWPCCGPCRSQQGLVVQLLAGFRAAAAAAAATPGAQHGKPKAINSPPAAAATATVADKIAVTGSQDHHHQHQQQQQQQQKGQQEDAVTVAAAAAATSS